jgi:hypothetical protein
MLDAIIYFINHLIKKINILPNNLNSILIGLMLGDGFIYRTSLTSNCRFEISFGKDRLSFAERISDLFIDFSNSGVKKVLHGDSYNFRFKTKTLPVFNYYHSIFYEQNNLTWKFKKIVPNNILELMDSYVLAYLIMTDGNFNMHVGVLHDRKDQYILTIGAKQLDLLRETVASHFEPSMLYRIGL